MTSILFYLATFFIVFVLQVYAMRQGNKNWRQLIVIFSFAIILFLIGFRYNVGTDYVGHVDTYNKYMHMSFSEIWLDRGDVGSKLIISFASHVLHDEKFIFWVYGLLTLYPIYKINKNSKYKYLAYSVLIFNLMILPVCLNILRQGAAMSFALLAFDYARRDSKKYLIAICMLAAVVLHTSALLMLPFIILYVVAKKHGMRYFVLSLVTSLVVSVFMVTTLKDFFIDIGFLDYNYMLRSSSSLGLSLGIVIYDLFYYVVLFIVFSLFKRGRSTELQAKNSDTRNMLGMIISGTIFEVVGTATKFLSRLSYYFSIYQVILLPELLQGIKNKNSRMLAKIMCVSALVLLFVFRCYIIGSYEIIPYTTWLFEGVI